MQLEVILDHRRAARERLGVPGAVVVHLGYLDVIVWSLMRVAEEVGGEAGEVIALEATTIRLVQSGIEDAVAPKHQQEKS